MECGVKNWNTVRLEYWNIACSNITLGHAQGGEQVLRGQVEVQLGDAVQSPPYAKQNWIIV